MKLPFKESSISTLIVVPSAIIVVILGVMQYRWSTGVSEATAVRLADSLQMSLVNWQIDFYRYFADLTVAMRVDSLEAESKVPVNYGRRFARWQEVARYPKLVSSIYLLAPDDLDEPKTMRMNLEGTFEPSTWPSELQAIRPSLRLMVESGWWFDPSIPALFQPVQPSTGGKRLVMAIELNLDEIRNHVFPDLSHTYFQGTNGLDYLVAVTTRKGPLYESDPGFGSPEPQDADGTINMFARPQSTSVDSPVKVFHAPSNDKGPSTSMRISWFPFLEGSDPDLDWRLVVRHRRGGALGAFVAEIGRRDLAIGFGMILVLILNMGMLVVISHRAQRLAQLQMNFVTAVSHELRTPLTVIISGADNICNGVVESSPQTQQYGSLIGKQARQLFGLVERILLFASTRQGQQQYNLRPVQVEEVIEAALASTGGLIEAGQFTVERTIAPKLPQILADSSALSQCLQNLITNALKYGNEQHWLGVRAEAKEGEIQISVSDRGIGISPADLAHIFEPFYRSPSVIATQIHGTGLGLPLSQSIAEAMKGRLTVSSELGKGSTFTLHIPALPAS